MNTTYLPTRLLKLIQTIFSINSSYQFKLYVFTVQFINLCPNMFNCKRGKIHSIGKQNDQEIKQRSQLFIALHLILKGLPA